MLTTELYYSIALWCWLTDWLNEEHFKCGRALCLQRCGRALSLWPEKRAGTKVCSWGKAKVCPWAGMLCACKGVGVLSLSLSLSLSHTHTLSLWPAKRVCAGVLYEERERETGSEREREREREREGDVEYVQNYLFSKGMMSALAPFSYLVR